MSNRKSWVSYTLIGVAALLTLAWTLTVLLPGAGEMMLDMVVTMLLTIAVAALLWHAGSRSVDAKTFWRLLAVGWAVNLPGNIAWGVYEMITGESLPILSFVDAIYATRYVLVLLALHRYPGQASGRRWPSLLAVLAAATAVTWVLLYRPTLMAAEITLSRVRDFIGVAMYPMMDIVLIYAAVLTWVRASKSHLRNGLGILTLALAFYNIANWFQFGNRAVTGFTSAMPDIFWPLSDVLAGFAATYALWRAEGQERTAVPRTAKALWLTKTPYMAGVLTIGVMLIDLILCGRGDLVLVVCSALAIGAMVGRYWLPRNGNTDTLNK
jgi:hypothetical protein